MRDIIYNGIGVGEDRPRGRISSNYEPSYQNRK